VRVVVLPGFDDPLDMTAQSLIPCVNDLRVFTVWNYAVAVSVDEQDRDLRLGHWAEAVNGIEPGGNGFLVILEIVGLE
jgi:hypothetical protein